MISAADLEAVRKLDATVRDEALDDLSALPSVAAVLAYLATQARAEGEDEADWVEMVVRLAEMPPGAVRAAEAVLRAMGYRMVADRLREIAGRRKHALAPLSE
jgi:hypothetical protein